MAGDIFKPAGALIIIVEVRVKARISRPDIDGKDSAAAEIAAVGKAELHCRAVSGHLVHHVLRNVGGSGLYGKVHIICMVCRHIPAVHSPDDSASHVEGDGDVLPFHAVKHIAGHN